MKLSILYASTVLCLSATTGAIAQNKTAPRVSVTSQAAQYATLPNINPSFGKGVSGHIAAVLKYGPSSQDSLLLVAGGCNFPDTPVSQGGARRYYSSVYGMDANKQWTQLGELPVAMAYASWAICPQGRNIVVSGGRSDGGDLDLAYVLSLTQGGSLQTLTLPRLSETRSGAAGAISGDRFYIIGGQANGHLTNSVHSISLSDPSTGWRIEPPYPQQPLMKVLATGTSSGKIYLLGSVVGFEGDRSAKLALSFMSYDPQQNRWETLPLPKDLDTDSVSFGGGMILATKQGFMVAGGVCPAIFMPAIQREQKLRKAKQRNKTRIIEKLTTKGHEYLVQPIEWYRFSPQLWHYDEHTKEWQRLPDSPSLSRADGVMVYPNLVVGGELKPGIRTPEISTYSTQ